jgi:hypothetical protein
MLLMLLIFNYDTVHANNLVSLYKVNNNYSKQGRIQEFGKGGSDGEREARAYNGNLRAEPSVGFRGKAPGQGVRGTLSP